MISNHYFNIADNEIDFITHMSGKGFPNNTIPLIAHSCRCLFKSIIVDYNLGECDGSLAELQDFVCQGLCIEPVINNECLNWLDTSPTRYSYPGKDFCNATAKDEEFAIDILNDIWDFVNDIYTK